MIRTGVTVERMKRLLVVLLVLVSWNVCASAQAPYFQGKTVRFIVGYPAGSTHDLWARLVGPYMTKYIPGNPMTIVQNMPGAGSAVAANYVYSAAKPDGLNIAVVNAGLYFDQLLGRKEVQFDWSKFSWVGSTTRSESLLYMWSAAPYKTIQDVRSATTPPKCGSTGTGNTGYYLPKLLEETIGAKFTVVTGYQGGAEIGIGRGARRSAVPRHQHPRVLRPRAVPYLASERTGAHLDPDGKEKGSALARGANSL